MLVIAFVALLAGEGQWCMDVHGIPEEKQLETA